MANVFVALIHHPVVDKNGSLIAAAVTSIDLHDIARAARTYGVRAFYVVTPVSDQIELVKRIIDHWVHGAGARYNPDRRQALELIRTAESLQQVSEQIRRETGQTPLTVATSARAEGVDLDFEGCRKIIKGQQPLVLLFGTAWGLAPEVITNADLRLEPIGANSSYNHLSVRSAVSIILDRLIQVAGTEPDGNLSKE